MGERAFVLAGPAAMAFWVMLLTMAASVVGDAAVRVIECRRRRGQRERELAALEAYHALAFPRPTEGKPPAGPA